MNVTCTNCGRVGFAVTREHAEREVARFNEYYDHQPPEVQEMFGTRRSSLDLYRCLVCGGDTFRAYADGDCPDGCTLSAVIA